jgi:hypothetical protein
MIRKFFLCLCILVFLLATGCWARSYFIHEAFTYNTAQYFINVVCDHGRLRLKMVIDPHGPVTVWPDTPSGVLLSDGFQRFRFSEWFGCHFELSTDRNAGWQWKPSGEGEWFAFYNKWRRPSRRQIYAIASLGPVCALFAVWPVVALVRGPLRRYRRRRTGQCMKCGYNLTGNVSGICPECGEQI